MQLISLLKPTSCAFVRLLPRVQPHSIAARARVAAMSTAAAAGMPPSPPPKSPAEIAAERAGMTLEEAFAIDQVEGGLFKKLGPEPIVKLAHEFYDRVYADDAPWFKAVFASSPKEVAIRNQYEFMWQRMGGPPVYSQRRGHPALPRRHVPFECTERTAERYMMHMDAALKAVKEIDADSAVRLYNYFKHTCFFLAWAQEMREEMMKQQQQQQQQGGSGGGCPMHQQATPPAGTPAAQQ